MDSLLFLIKNALWNGRKPGSTEALVLKAPLFTWSVKSFSCYNVLRLADSVANLEILSPNLATFSLLRLLLIFCDKELF